MNISRFDQDNYADFELLSSEDLALFRQIKYNKSELVYIFILLYISIFFCSFSILLFVSEMFLFNLVILSLMDIILM